MPDIIDKKLYGAALAKCMARCGEELHVFAYGSLLWRPGFAVQKESAARVFGYARRLAIRSTHYRGTETKPGLVFGLDAGGSCCGAVLTAKAKTKFVLPKLFRREMFANAYVPVFVRANLLDGGAMDGVLTFIVNRKNNPRFAPPTDMRRAANIIRAARGEGGKNSDYIFNTRAELKRRGVHCPQLEKLCALLG